MSAPRRRAIFWGGWSEAPLPLQPRVHLPLARPNPKSAIGVLQGHDSVAPRPIQPLHVEGIEHIEIHPQPQSFANAEKFQERRIGCPIERTQPVLLTPWMQTSVHAYLHRAPIFQPDVDVVRIPQSR